MPYNEDGGPIISHLVRKDSKRSILVDPLPSESRGVAINAEHTICQLLLAIIL